MRSCVLPNEPRSFLSVSPLRPFFPHGWVSPAGIIEKALDCFKLNPLHSLTKAFIGETHDMGAVRYSKELSRMLNNSEDRRKIYAAAWRGGGDVTLHDGTVYRITSSSGSQEPPPSNQPVRPKTSLIGLCGRLFGRHS